MICLRAELGLTKHTMLSGRLHACICLLVYGSRCKHLAVFMRTHAGYVNVSSTVMGLYASIGGFVIFKPASVVLPWT
jgi:hypothetical protein